MEAWWYEKAKAMRAVELKGELHCRGVLATVEMIAAALKEKEPRRTGTVDRTAATATADRYCPAAAMEARNHMAAALAELINREVSRKD